MKNIIIIVLVLVFFVNFGCNDNSTKVIVQSVLIPLHVNNYWIYKTTTFDSNANVVEVRYDTLKLLNDTSIYSKTYFLSSFATCFNSSSWGIYEFTNLKSFNKELAVYKYPCSLNETYIVLDTAEVNSFDSDKIDTVKAEYIIANLDTNISVPSGTYSCIYYKPNNKDKFNNVTLNYSPFTPKTWIAPNVGIVRMELLFNYKGKNIIIRELVKYEIY